MAPERAWMMWAARAVLAAGCLGLALVAAGALEAGLAGAGPGREAALIGLAEVTVGVYLLLVLVGGPREWRLRAGLVVGGALLAGGLGELGVRALRPEFALPPLQMVASRRLHHRLPPDVEMFDGFYGGRPMRARTNADGLRTPHDREAFRRAPRRIACLGDSFTFGVGVPDEESYPAKLEARLRAGEQPGASVLNAGQVGYTPLLSRLQYQHVVRAYRPELVIFLLDTLDFGGDVLVERDALGGDPERGFVLRGPTTIRSWGGLARVLDLPLRTFVLDPQRALWGGLGRQLGLLEPRPPTRASQAYVKVRGRPDVAPYFVYRHPPEALRPFAARSFAHLAALRDAARADGARLVLVIGARYTQFAPHECPRDWEVASGAFRRPPPHPLSPLRAAEAAATELGVPTLSLLPVLQRAAASHGPLTFDGDPHWNARGNAVVAAAVAAWLAELEI